MSAPAHQQFEAPLHMKDNWCVDSEIYVDEYTGALAAWVHLHINGTGKPPEWWPEVVTWSEGDIADTYGDDK